ncbi:MAG TPA: GlxA family transcriptional regulator [Acidimicrobiales bacterium]|nr:GlxA family transcriptional regulator [Acidimicrobiales bacterium]
MRPRPVVAVVFPQFQMLDAAGPLEVFATATRLLPEGHGYTVGVVAPEPGPVRSSSGMALEARGLGSVRGPLDTLLVAGGLGAMTARDDPVLVGWLRRRAARSRRVVSVCTGAFLLAEAGLLDGRPVTTHWAWCTALQREYPALVVDADPIFVRHGEVATSAGVTAGMDLALSLVEEDHGAALALEVARWLVLFLKRPGGQAQFSGHLRAQLASRPALAELQGWMADHLDADLSVAALARRAGMGTRTLARTFKAEVGSTPAAYVEHLRVETARRWLEEGERSTAMIARAAGFGTVETMYRAFQRVVGVPPGEYRQRFGGPRATA